MWSLYAVSAVVVSAGAAIANDQLHHLTQHTPPLIPLQQYAGTADLFPMADCFGFKLEEATIDQMQKAMEEGRLTSVGLVTCYMTRAFQTEQYIKSVLDSS